MAKRTKRAPLVIAGNVVEAGTKAQLEIPIARLMAGTPVSLPVVAFHGRQPGVTAWISAAIHGDEIGGVDSIRRVLDVLTPAKVNGSIIILPVVNVHGFNTGSRYLPDRRDLNRSFPGASKGSLASRVAKLVMDEVVAQCTVGVDLHTGSGNRTNLPQVRGDLDDPEVLRLAQAFGAPVSLHAKIRDGSLRQAARDEGARVLLFEGGENDRFDEDAIQVATDGVLRVLQACDIISEAPARSVLTRTSRQSSWMRASQSGICRLEVALGEEVTKGSVLAIIRDPFGKRLASVKSRIHGVVIGHSQRPLVNRGDAIVHLAAVD